VLLTIVWKGEALLKARRQFMLFSICFIAILFISSFAIGKLLVSPSITDYSAQAQKDFDNARLQVERIRNVTLPEVNLHVVTKQWAIDTWGKGYADPDITNILRQEKFYKGIFLIPQNASLYQANVDWAGNFGAATWGDQIYVVQENFDPWNLPGAEATFVHELMHIWQPDLVTPKSFDMDKAHTALVEGDASYMGDYFINQTKAQASPEIAVDQIPLFLLTNPALSSIRLMPDAIWNLNFFPYDQGKTFVSALYQEGSWKTIDNAYTNPPSTTEQILHPEKYFSNESAQLTRSPTLAENTWTKIKTDSYGEYFIQTMLKNWLSDNNSMRASAGWAGDNFTYYERGSDYLFTWNIKWDSSCDASDFYVLFHSMMNATGSVDYGSCNWFSNDRYLMINWDQKTNSTLIACSPIQSATQQSYFS
jgi:hypothetical protein